MIITFLILVTAAIGLFFVEKMATSSKNPRRKLLSAGSLCALLIVLLAIILLSIGIRQLFDAARSISSGFSMSIWIPFGVIVAAFTVFEVMYSLRENDELDESKLSPWRKRWAKTRPIVGFSLVWMIVVFILNVVLWQIENPQWLALWKFKGSEGHPFFYFLMLLFVISMLLMVNVKTSSIKLCGLAIFALATYGWTDTVEKTVPGPNRVVIEKVLIPSGQVREFYLDDIVEMDDLPSTFYRVNRKGGWKERKFGEPWNLPRDANRIEFKAVQELLIKERKRV